MKFVTKKKYTIEQVCDKLATDGKIVILEISGNANYYDSVNTTFFVVKPKDIRGLIKYIKLEYGQLIVDADDKNTHFENNYKKFIEDNILYFSADHSDYIYLKIYGLSEIQFNQIVNPNNFTEFNKSRGSQY
ncbi:putative orfan [Tupanvirus soda lake]|uniref:Orfan n=2 Tax=Tupanvirus TaxID=2094720 RepID=A0AC62ADT9_9VIRU|nr:putative orfan [Tupanvirus soda lake]QKU35965.1 putative orfan [Tupanvirus soda lake]